MTSGKMGVLDEFELHALIDGHVDDRQRKALLRRLASSPTDRARVEAWQGHNDLLRSVFAGIENDPLPAMLDLSAAARLQCIPANDAPITASKVAESRPGRWAQRSAVAATMLVVATGLGGSWLLFDTARPGVAAIRSSTAVNSATATGFSGLTSLPTSQIPDLGAHGFRFTGAETIADPATLLFRYEAGPDRIAISVSYAGPAKDGAASPVWTGNRYVWRQNATAYAISGTPKPERLRTIAVSLHEAQVSQ